VLTSFSSISVLKDESDNQIAFQELGSDGLFISQSGEKSAQNFIEMVCVPKVAHGVFLRPMPLAASPVPTGLGASLEIRLVV
jgi:hypothetical protein